jgi:hypothetical protein
VISITCIVAIKRSSPVILTVIVAVTFILVPVAV